VSEQWFRDELRKYRKVRDASWQAWASPSVPSIAAKQAQLVGSQSKSGSTSISHSPVTEGDFWALFRQRLIATFGDVAADRILADFRQRHSKFIASLSFDDLERLAIAVPTK